MTIEEVKQKLAAGTIRAYKINNPKSIVLPVEQKKTKKRTKYGNHKTEIDGIKFDSSKEANRYKELKLLLKAGEIGLLELQVPFELNEGGTYSLRYIADFVYVIRSTGEKIIEDVKGFRTKDYRKKRRLMWKVHKIKINEV